jgi:hypothetical protein
LNLTTSWRRNVHASNPHLNELPANLKGTFLHSSVSGRVETMNIQGLDINKRIYGTTQNISPVTGAPYEYRIPDFRLNSPNVIFDIKPSGIPLTGPQFEDFRLFSGSDDI